MKANIGQKIVQVILSFFIVVFFALNCGVIYFIVRNVPMKETEYSSFQEFRDAGAAGYMYMPESATEQEYYLNYTGMSLHSIYSFRVEDKEEYDRCMEDFKYYSCTEIAATNPAWNWYGKYEATEKEQEQMNYLQNNYNEMTYRKVLDYSRIGKGFANGYGASVSEFMNLDYSLGNFPRHMDFETVVPDEIETYTILYYSPLDSGTCSEGILVNEATRRFVIFYLSNAR